MNVYSFARNSGHAVRQFGSAFVLTPIAELGAGRASCMHLAAGEAVGEHEAVGRQLFCVVAGSGWVSGSDGVQVPIEAAQVAAWEPGELHAAGTEQGLTAIVLEGAVTARA